VYNQQADEIQRLAIAAFAHVFLDQAELFESLSGAVHGLAERDEISRSVIPV
jgi:hypothetical protein